MNNMEKSAVAICTYEAYRDMVLTLFSELTFTVIDAADTKETDITLKALHQFNLSRDKILRQLASGSLKLQNWVRESPGRFLAYWLHEHGSRLGTPFNAAAGKAGPGDGSAASRKRKLDAVGVDSSSPGQANANANANAPAGDTSENPGDNAAQFDAFNRFHAVDPAEDAYCKELYTKKIPEERHVLQDRVKNFLKFLKEYHGFFKKTQVVTGVSELFVQAINQLRSPKHEIMQYFYRDKQVVISKDVYATFLGSHDSARVEAALAAMLQKRQVLFPLKRYLDDYQKFASMFEKLQHLADRGRHRVYFSVAPFTVPVSVNVRRRTARPRARRLQRAHSVLQPSAIVSPVVLFFALACRTFGLR